ncbi:hypothetical protein Tco_1085451 [Tanacetum coccineum]
MDEPEPHPAYDFFAPGPLPSYDGNPNNTNGWIETDVPLLGELGKMVKPLGAEVDEPMVDLVIEELAEPIAAPMVVKEGDEEFLMAPVTPPLVPVMPSPSTYEVGGSSTAAAEGHSFTLLPPEILLPSSVIKDLCTRMVNLEYGHGLLLKKVIMVSDAEVADNIAIGEISPRVSTMEGQMQVLASQMVQVVSESEQVRDHMEQGQQAATQRGETITGLSQQVQTL